ncbi:MAG TPA: hypothetical protein VII58_06000 [Acidobacteriaceae bacterium]
MSAAVVVPEILPFVWAFALENPGAQPDLPGNSRPPEPQMAFYRKYTEAMLRRYVRMSMEAGKVPSLLGKEMFRSKITSYRVESFEDVMIFIHDVEHCLEQLDLEQQRLIARISLQEYTLLEAAVMLGLPPRTTVRRYCQALDRLTRIFLHARMLEPQKMMSRG